MINASNFRIIQILQVLKPKFISVRIGKICNSILLNKSFSNINTSTLFKSVNELSVNNKNVISVILPSGKVISIMLNKAQKLADKKNLKLIKLENSNLKSDKILYKFTAIDDNTVDPNVIEFKDVRRKIPSKSLTISQCIYNHDLNVKIKQMIRFIQQGMKVEVKIHKASNSSRTDEIIETIIKGLEKLIKKSEKVELNHLVKLNLVPLKIDNKNKEDDVSDTATSEVKEISNKIIK